MEGKNEGVTFRIREEGNMIAENVKRRTPLRETETGGISMKKKRKGGGNRVYACL
jgi:hypothetical protein